ncbi:MAG: flagellar biosynthesis anti-sigma factor FlgM [Pseudomonadota bacterium]
MVSEINNLNPSQLTGIDRKSTAVTADNKTDAVKQPSASDSVTLTELVSKVDELTKSVEKLPVVDAEKVARLREDIASGKYQVDTQAVAEKFSAIERILSSSVPQD